MAIEPPALGAGAQQRGHGDGLPMGRRRTLHPEQAVPSALARAALNLPDLESLGLLTRVICHASDAPVRLDDLAKHMPALPRRAFSRARATLVRTGYWVSVKYRHTYRGQVATDVYCAAAPHSDDDLAELGRRYRPGTGIQVPRGGEATITWARVSSFRGEQLVSETGALLASRAEERAPAQESVYVIGARGGTLVKIGTSRSIPTRLAQLQHGSPDQLEVLWHTVGGEALERALHRRFRDRRRQGEWFAFDDMDPVDAVAAAVDKVRARRSR